MEITGSVSYPGAGLSFKLDVPDRLFLTRRDRLALAAPNPSDMEVNNHNTREYGKAQKNDTYIRQEFDYLAWKYTWADRMIAASGE